MPAVIDSTCGSVTANSYVDLTTAEQYFSERLYTTIWDSATDDTKNRSLIQATRQIDSFYQWIGFRADEFQVLEWPRTEAYSCSTGASLPSDEIPTQIQYAQMELALWLLQYDSQSIDINLAKGIKSASVDVLSVEFNKAFTSSSVSKMVDSFISCLGRRKNSSNGLLWRL